MQEFSAYFYKMNILARYAVFFVLFILMTAATFRTSGLDYPVYLSEFLDPINSLSSGEIGYVFVIKTVGKFAGFWFVLLLANITFVCAHRRLISRIQTFSHALVFIFYVTYVGLFLIYGSPRRLIAYSLVVFVILAIAFNPADVRRRLWSYLAIVGCAAAFHVSALVFLPVLLVYGREKTAAKSGWKTGLVVLALIVVGYLLYAGGAVDYITAKIFYYAIEAAGEQAYLEDVPSVTSGLLKRAVAISLLWVGTRHMPDIRRPSLCLCLIEIFIYGSLGAFSPVLAVVASYFALGYVLPILNMQSTPGTISLDRLALIGSAAVYFIPTSIGLIKLFGDFYV